jgi:hypothetical protein
MAGKGAVLASRILNEISSLAVVVARVESAWKAAAANNDEFYFDSVALNIHSFYSGLERVFEKISSAVDGSLPQGLNWHQELLNQMALEIPDVRPAVISEKTRQQLDTYRGFRHVVRNVYTYHISPDKMKPLAKGIRPVFKQIEKELTAFSRFIKNK